MDCSPPGTLLMGFSKQEYRSGLPCPATEEKAYICVCVCVCVYMCVYIYIYRERDRDRERER